MQDPWSVIAVVLLAVLVGVALPVLIQLFVTLGAMRRGLLRLAPRLETTLGEMHEAARRVNRATSGLDDSARRAQKLLVAAGDLGQTLQGLNSSLRTAAAVGHAVGPAVAAAVRALAERDAPGREAPPVGHAAPEATERYNPSEANGGDRT